MEQDNEDIKVTNEGTQTNKENPLRQTIIINNKTSSNGAGTAGFVLAIIALFVGWIPVLGWIVWILGLIFSIIGATRKPKGLAIAGLVISLIGLILLILVIIGISAASVLR